MVNLFLLGRDALDVRAIVVVQVVFKMVGCGHIDVAKTDGAACSDVSDGNMVDAGHDDVVIVGQTTIVSRLHTA